MKFAVMSDLHYCSDIVQQTLPIKNFINYVNDKTNAIDFAAITGDLTDCGNNGQTTCLGLIPLLTSIGCKSPQNNVLVGGSVENQLAEFIDKFVSKINIPLYLIQGNHDMYNGASKYPVTDYIVERHGGTYYYFERDSSLFIFCDVYPTFCIRLWLEWLLFFKQAKHNKTPLIFFFHYNIQDAFSDWWSVSDKKAFYEIIKNMNVLGIFVGHYHVSYNYMWNGINVWSTAGEAFAECELTNGKLSVTFMK